MADKPFSFRTAGSIQQGFQLDSASLRRVAPVTRSLTVDPALPPIIAANGSDPTRNPPSGHFRYVRANNIVWFQFSVSIAVLTAPQGVLTLRIPGGTKAVTTDAGNVHCGTWTAQESGASPNRMDGWLEASFGTLTDPYTNVSFAYRTAATPGVATYLGYNAPWVWGTNGNFLTGSGHLLIADAFTSST